MLVNFLDLKEDLQELTLLVFEHSLLNAVDGLVAGVLLESGPFEPLVARVALDLNVGALSPDVLLDAQEAHSSLDVFFFLLVFFGCVVDFNLFVFHCLLLDHS